MVGTREELENRYGEVVAQGILDSLNPPHLHQLMHQARMRLHRQKLHALITRFKKVEQAQMEDMSAHQTALMQKIRLEWAEYRAHQIWHKLRSKNTRRVNNNKNNNKQVI